jgi:hypothetical protein
LYHLDIFFLKVFIQYSTIKESTYGKQGDTAEQEDCNATKHPKKKTRNIQPKPHQLGKRRQGVPAEWDGDEEAERSPHRLLPYCCVATSLAPAELQGKQASAEQFFQASEVVLYWYLGTNRRT